MKILYHIPYPGGIGDDRTIYDGYKYAFEDLGHDFFTLTEHDDLNQTLITLKPDLFITATAIINPLSNAAILKKYRDAGGVVLMRGGALEHETELLRLIRENVLADIYANELALPRFTELTGKPLHILPLAASRKYHFPTPSVKKYECDILYIGANLPKKRDLFRRRLLPLRQKYNIKIFGPDWDIVDRYLLHPLAKLERMIAGTSVLSQLRIDRQVPYIEENQAYGSAKICLNFHEQQPDGLLLLNGRTFKIPASGGFELCDRVPQLRDYFAADEVVMTENDDDFFAKIDYYLTYDAKRKAIQEKGTVRALREHTYHNRVKTVIDLVHHV